MGANNKKSQITGMLGVYLTAAELTSRDYIVSPTSRSASGGELYGDAEQRLRFAFQLVRMLAEKEDPTVIQSWLTGLNPELGDRVPLRLLRENDRERRRSWELPALSSSARDQIIG